VLTDIACPNGYHFGNERVDSFEVQSGSIAQQTNLQRLQNEADVCLAVEKEKCIGCAIQETIAYNPVAQFPNKGCDGEPHRLQESFGGE